MYVIKLTTAISGELNIIPAAKKKKIPVLHTIVII